VAMGTTSIHVTYRPLRIGFLLRDGDIESLAKAATINSLLWGGIFNPVIPVGDDLQLVKKLVEIFRIDTLFKLDDTIELDSIYSKYAQIRHAQELGGLNFLDREWQTARKTPHCLDLLNIMDDIWNTRAHAWPPEKKGDYIKVSWDAADREAKVFAILFGAFPQPSSIFENDFTKTLHAEEVNISNDAEVPTALAMRRSLIQLSSYRMKRGFHERPGHGLYLGRSDSFADLLSFWNLRAAGIPIMFCSYDNYARWASFTKCYFSQLDKRVGVSQGQRVVRSIYYYSLDEGEVTNFQQSLGPETKLSKHALKKLCHIHPSVYIPPIVAFLHDSATLANVENSGRGYKISLPLPPKWFFDAESSGFGWERLTALFSATTEFEYPMHTIRVPYLKDLTECFGRRTMLDPFEVVLQENSIGRMIAAREDSVSLYPLSYDDMIADILARQGITSKFSQAGILVKQILAQLGGLEDCKVLQIRGVRRLIKDYRANECVDKAIALKTIGDAGSFKRFENLYIEAGERATPLGAFNLLLKKGLFRAGLSLKCTNCRLENWLSLRQIDDHWICEYCGAEQGISTLLTEKETGRWKFRKSGLLAKDNNQEGAIPVLLTLLQCKRVLDLSGFVFSPSMTLSTPEMSCETDLCVLQYLRHEEASWHVQSKLEVGIGECKDEGGRIDEEDVQKLKHIHSCFDGKDIRCYLIFSKTADSFAPAEIGLFRGLRQDGIPLILFTNRELESWYPYEHVQGQTKRLLPAQTLQKMSWISSSLYL